MSTSATQIRKPKIIDSHLHVWANSKDEVKVFPYVVDPPDTLKDAASTSELLKHMDNAGVDGALIVQPINHKYDHSYVIQAIQKYPNRLKGMMLFDPNIEKDDDAISRFEELVLHGFVGVRYNPYLWKKLSDNNNNEQEQQSPPRWSPMSEGIGLSVYKRCGELNIPVGVMCFQGLSLHYDDIIQLLEASPQTTLILDHFAFTSIRSTTGTNSNNIDKEDDDDDDGDIAFQQLLDLAMYPQVIVKISALFRLGDTTSSSYENVYTKRFVPLLQAYGSNRLMYGSDFPFVLEQPQGYDGMVKLVTSWTKRIVQEGVRKGKGEGVDDDDNDDITTAIMGGTAERVFGRWGTTGT